MRPPTALLALVLLTTGCGSVDSAGPAESSSADTARFEMVMTRTDMRGRMVISGVTDYPRRRALLQTSFEGGADPGESFNGLGEPGDELRIFGNTSYTQWTVRGDKTYWVEETEEPSSSPSEVIVPFPGSRLDPARAYELIQSAGDEVKELGQEAVRGEATTHYRITVDPTALPERALDETKPFPVEVWADADDRLRRMRVTDEFLDGSATITYEFFDFGVEVDVERPTQDVISSERLDELTRPTDEELRELCEEEIPEDVCAEAEEGE
jgi:hypothetical protein